MCIKFPYEQSQILMLWFKLFFPWPLARFYVFHSYITFWLTLWRDRFLLLAIENKPISLLAQNAESSLLWTQAFFFYCVKLSYAVVNSMSFTSKKTLLRIILVWRSIDTFSQWILTVPMACFSHQIVNYCQLSDCCPKNNKKSLNYSCSG